MPSLPRHEQEIIRFTTCKKKTPHENKTKAETELVVNTYKEKPASMNASCRQRMHSSPTHNYNSHSKTNHISRRPPESLLRTTPGTVRETPNDTKDTQRHNTPHPTALEASIAGMYEKSRQNNGHRGPAKTLIHTHTPSPEHFLCRSSPNTIENARGRSRNMGTTAHV